MYADSESVLSFIQQIRSHNNPIVTVLFSDGNTERLERILNSHKIRDRDFFDEIVIGKKSLITFEETKQLGGKHLASRNGSLDTVFLMIGDSLKRDIKLGNQAGYVTVYKPANFFGRETPQEADEHPWVVLKK